MSAPKPFESSLLQPAEALLLQATSRLPGASAYEARLQLLEAASSRLGTFSLRDYFNAFKIEPLFKWAELERVAAEVVRALSKFPAHPSLALSALAREPLVQHEQRESGAYYTDFRLATLVAELAVALRIDGRPVIDPACGSGILLCALTAAVCGIDRRRAGEWLARYVHASDMSTLALRGACLSLASFTDDLDAVVSMRKNWYCGDSLLRPKSQWLTLAPQGYGVVAANPPWEKVKTTRHEFAKAQGAKRHYGASHDDVGLHGYEDAKREAFAYARALAERYPLIAGGEVDLYAAFVELFLYLARDGGAISALVPGGLIRSQSTEKLRTKLIGESSQLSIGVLDNKAKFFSIDTRFKFLAVSSKTKHTGCEAKEALKEVRLSHFGGTESACEERSSVRVPIAPLQSMRRDLSFPEVRTAKEWKLFSTACRTGVDWNDNDSEHWRVDFCREVDMTKHRPHFKATNAPGRLPVVEGRMVQHHRFGAKSYISGTGRAALWSPNAPGRSEVKPQFWTDESSLTPAVLARAKTWRAGFCDIAGQTNERSMMAAAIPPGHVCGNKVPTVAFDGPHAETSMWLWIALVNSLPFDWLLRRVLTTTVNYFLLRSVPLPSIRPNTLQGRRLADAARELASTDVCAGDRASLLRAASLRAEVDVTALQAYGAGFEDLATVLDDFPLLDRGQPVLEGETKSSITRDFVLLVAAKRFRLPYAQYAKRVERALALGALPYVPAVNAEDSSGEDSLAA